MLSCHYNSNSKSNNASLKATVAMAQNIVILPTMMVMYKIGKKKVIQKSIINNIPHIRRGEDRQIANVFSNDLISYSAKCV